MKNDNWGKEQLLQQYTELIDDEDQFIGYCALFNPITISFGNYATLWDVHFKST